MVAANEVWNMVEPVVSSLGLKLFDVEIPGGENGILRIFIVRENGRSDTKDAGITVDDCAQVSRTLSDTPGFEESLPDRWLIEVSSPGVNRRLGRPEHFVGAVGERVKVKWQVAEKQYGVVKGVLSSFDGTQMVIEDEESKSPVHIQLSQIREARIDFNF